MTRVCLFFILLMFFPGINSLYGKRPANDPVTGLGGSSQDTVPATAD
jgi:hypothetical protein